jgi:hypothetical protein
MSRLLPTLAGSESRPAGGSADTPRGAAGNAGVPAGPPPAPRPTAGATMTGSVIGGIGSSRAAAPTPGTTSMTGGSEAGGSCISGGSSGRPLGTSMPPPPPPPPPGAGRPTAEVEVDVDVDVDVDVEVEVDVDVPLVVSLGLSVVVGGAVEGVGEGLGGVDGGLLEPQCCALPLLPLLPQLPLLGFAPTPGLSVSVSVFSSVFVAGPVFVAGAVFVAWSPLPSGSVFGPLPGSSVFEWVSPGISGDVDGSAIASAPPRAHRKRPEATTQADAAPSTREPTSSPPLKAPTAAIYEDSSILAQPPETVCCGAHPTPDRDTPIPSMIRTIVLGCSIAATS